MRSGSHADGTRSMTSEVIATGLGLGDAEGVNRAGTGGLPAHPFDEDTRLTPRGDGRFSILPAGRVAVSDRVECRAPMLPGWRSARPTGSPHSEFWMRFREPRDPDVHSLALLVDAAAPAVFELGESGSVTVQLTVHVRAHPAAGWLRCRHQPVT
jgi:acyl-Coa thioesterase superfamily protein